MESWVGRGFISLSTIFWYKALRLKGSTVKGRVPVNMAYMFTPLKRETPKHEIRKRLPGRGRHRRLGLGNVSVLSRSRPP